MRNPFTILSRLSPFFFRYRNVIVILLLALLFVQAVTSMRLKSSVCDEHAAHIISGHLYLESGQFSGGLNNPPLVQVLIALPLKLIGADYQFFSDEYLFHVRLPIVLLSLMLAYFVYRWAKEAYGWKSGLMALTLYAFSPDILAHSRLATVDLGSACFIFISCYFLWKTATSPSLKYLVLTGLSFALAQLSKFSSIYLLPVFLAIAVVLLFSSKETPLWKRTAGAKIPKRLLVILIGGLVVAGITVLAVNVGYKFQDLSTIVPSQFLDGIRGKLFHSQKGHFAFLMGNRSRGGWWYYYLVAFLIKTPLAFLFILGMRLIFTRFKEKATQAVSYYLLIPAVTVFALASYARVNIGIRHILPVYPFLFVWASGVASSRSKRLPAFLLLLLGWYVVSSVVIFPHYLAYFNEAVGGPRNGYKHLIDSNLDWGQDDKLLTRYRAANPDLVVNPDGDTPAVGKIAINANSLQNILKMDNRRYAWARSFTPSDYVGYSWLVYDLELSDYESYVREKPTDPWGYLYLGMINRTLGNPQDAASNMKKAMSLDPNLGAAYVELSRVYADQDSLDPAIATLREGRRRNPDDLNIRSELKLLLATKSVKEAPEDADSYLKLGEALMGRNDLTAAADEFTRALELDDRLAKAYLYLGWIRGKQSDFHTAIDLAKRGMTLNEEHQQDGARMIRVLSQNLALQQRKDDPRALYLMALWEHDNERYLAAVELLKKAIELDPTYQDALWVLGDIFVQTKLRTADTGLID